MNISELLVKSVLVKSVAEEEQVSILYEGREYTNANLDCTARKLGNALMKLGVKRGDRVILQMPNCPEIFSAFQAIWKIGAVSVPINYQVGMEMNIFDNQDREVPPGQEGEIVLRGPMVMKGCWRQPEATAEIIRNGWLHTVDIGYVDADGYFFIADRKKDIIIKGGENISPRAIEEVLYAHPTVAEAAVIGVKDSVYGEEIKAFVALKPGLSATAEEIREFCRQKLKRFFVPREVAILPALPKSLVGKILKKELRKL